MKKTSDFPSNEAASAGLSAEEREKRLLSTAGLAARARKTVVGTGQICEELRKGSILLVLEASDTSDNTHKRLSDKTAFYGVPLYLVRAGGEALAQAFGKRNGCIAAVGITDSGIIRAMQKYLPSEQDGSDGDGI